MKTTIRNHIAILFLLAVVAVSCKKNNDAPNKTPEEILTANAWKASEMRVLANNTSNYYKRGSSSNSSNYNLDNESIVFKSDKTGTYYGATGGVFPFTWDFSNTEKTKLTWIVQFSSTTTVNWDIVELTIAKIKYNEYFTNGGISSQTFGERIPK